MTKVYENIIKRFTGAKSTYEIELIQSLWSGYGRIVRYGLEHSELNTIIIKHVQLPKQKSNIKGDDLSHKRKIKSYKVETAWYRQWSNLCNEACYVPRCFGVEAQGNEIFIVLEDLADSGFPLTKHFVSFNEMKLCISWLASFHATFMEKTPESLWNTGTYWHLDTRPDELRALEDLELKNFAHRIDLELKKSPYKTFVHGDAKLANFCFSKDGLRVAAVDFQYVGGGCGMKDLAYFVGSCLDENESESMEQEILDFYFMELKKALTQRHSDDSANINVGELEDNWRYLYPIAWADFHRFLKGWSVERFEMNSYSERVTREVIERIRGK